VSPVCRCELDDRSERVQTFSVGDSLELLGIQFTHTLTKRTRHRQDSFVASGVAVQISCKARQLHLWLSIVKTHPTICWYYWHARHIGRRGFSLLTHFYRLTSVCLSVCLSIRLSACLSITHRRCIETTKRNELVFWNVCFLPLILCVCYKEIRVSPKIRLHPAGTFVPNSALGNSPL